MAHGATVVDGCQWKMERRGVDCASHDPGTKEAVGGKSRGRPPKGPPSLGKRYVLSEDASPDGGGRRRGVGAAASRGVVSGCTCPADLVAALSRKAEDHSLGCRPAGSALWKPLKRNLPRRGMFAGDRADAGGRRKNGLVSVGDQHHPNATSTSAAKVQQLRMFFSGRDAIRS